MQLQKLECDLKLLSLADLKLGIAFIACIHCEIYSRPGAFGQATIHLGEVQQRSWHKSPKASLKTRKEKYRQPGEETKWSWYGISIIIVGNPPFRQSQCTVVPP